MLRRLALIAALGLGLASAREGFAQTNDPSHWGVGFSATPAWTMAPRIKELLADEGDVIDIKGSEFTIGVVRGSTLGGDWGVSYVRKPWTDGLGVSSSSTDCFTPGPGQSPVCLTNNEQNFFQRVTLSGIEAHWFIAPGFARIKNRVQIGANVGGGIAKVTGSVRTVKDRQEPVFTPGPGGGTTRVVTRHSDETKAANEELFPMFPLAKLELMGAFIAAPGLKIKAAGGLNFPGNGFRVLGVYLFGAR